MPRVSAADESTSPVAFGTRATVSTPPRTLRTTRVVLSRTRRVGGASSNHLVRSCRRLPSTKTASMDPLGGPPPALKPIFAGAGTPSVTYSFADEATAPAPNGQSP